MHPRVCTFEGPPLLDFPFCANSGGRFEISTNFANTKSIVPIKHEEHVTNVKHTGVGGKKDVCVCEREFRSMTVSGSVTQRDINSTRQKERYSIIYGGNFMRSRIELGIARAVCSWVMGREWNRVGILEFGTGPWIRIGNKYPNILCEVGRKCIEHSVHPLQTSEIQPLIKTLMQIPQPLNSF